MSCKLELKSAKAKLKSLVGLKYVHGQFVLDVDYFNCCNGIGQIELDQKSYVCALNQRYLQTQKLLQRAQQNKLLDSGFSIESKAIALSLNQSLQNIATKLSFRGKLFFHSDENAHLKKSRFDFFDIALCANWDFGIHVHYVVLGKTQIPELIKELSDYQGAQPQLVLLAQLDSLSTPQALQDFMVLVDFCYNGLLPIWIEVVDAKLKKNTKQSSRSSRSYVQKVQQQIPPMIDQLPEACKQRLLSYCKELIFEDYLLQRS